MTLQVVKYVQAITYHEVVENTGNNLMLHLTFLAAVDCGEVGFRGGKPFDETVLGSTDEGVFSPPKP